MQEYVQAEPEMNGVQMCKKSVYAKNLQTIAPVGWAIE